MNSNDVHVATMMLARSEAEATLLHTALESLARRELPVAVTDGGSPRQLIDAVTRLPGVALASARGLVPQVKASVRAALAGGREFILYTEPDKHHFFEHALGGFLERAPADAGLVVAGRDADSLRTFPPFQQLAERAINHLTGEAVGAEGDYSYGPFLLHRSLAALVERAPDTLGWGWRHFLFALARRHGARVVLVSGDFRCPGDQREETEADRAHRLAQLNQNLHGLMLATS